MLKGSLVALVTPMLKDGTIDFISLNNLIEFHISHKTDALVIVGATGEASTLSVDEHIKGC